MKNQKINPASACYNLPWSENNNPNGWIEPTSYCQLNCPGCYRGLDKENPKRFHAPLVEMKQQIDRHIKERNVQTISIAGGEPLLYPQILDLVRYASSLGLKVMIYTNAVALNKEGLIRLKEAGATKIVIHIDRFQNRPEGKNEKQLLSLREKFCSMFREVPGIGLGFIQPISKDSLADLDILIPYYQKNSDIISLLVFTLYKNILWDEKTEKAIDTNISLNDIIERLSSIYNYRPCSIYKNTGSGKEPTWVFSMNLLSNGRSLGSFDSQMAQTLGQRYYAKKNRYLFITLKHIFPKNAFIKFFFNPSTTKALLNYWRLVLLGKIPPFSKVHMQTTLLLRGPNKTNNGWDLCAGCPDAMYQGGKLVPSCILEYLRNNE